MQQTISLVRVSDDADVPFVLMPGITKNGTYRRVVAGSAVSGTPTAIEIKGDISAPSGSRQYSVARVVLTLNEGLDASASFGPQPIAAVQLSFNAPFGKIADEEVTFDEALEALHNNLFFLLQYIQDKGEATLYHSPNQADHIAYVFSLESFKVGFTKLTAGVR